MVTSVLSTRKRLEQLFGDGIGAVVLKRMDHTNGAITLGESLKALP